MWMDASIRFLTSNLDPMFAQARKNGLVLGPSGGSIAMRTHPSTFQYLQELPCTFLKTDEYQANFLLIYGNKFISDHFLRPWVSCALTVGCMAPEHGHESFIHCGKHGKVYHDCHRFDQSVVGILVYRLFYGDLDSHKIPADTIYIYRDEFYGSDYWNYFLSRIF